MADIHPTAIVDAAAQIGEGVHIGAFAVVGPKVTLDDDVRLESHVVVQGRTHIGAGTQVFPFAVLGHQPQDLKYAGEDTELRIGRNNRIREHVTMNPGTAGGGGVTEVGNGGLFMAAIHVAHDCKLGDGVIMANNATLGGHVHIGDEAFLGGLCAIHQFVRIGRQAMIGGLAGVEHDVIPYGMVLGNRARLNGLNVIGMKRRGLTRDEIHDLRTAYRLLFLDTGEFAQRLDDTIERYAARPRVMELVDFVRSAGARGLCLPRTSRDEVNEEA